jgi:DNA-binding response OmpR family regulator
VTKRLGSPVLVVEDDENIAKLIATYLRRDGFDTVIAGDGVRALALAGQFQPGFVILDLMLPGTDGWEVCRRLRARSDVPIIMLTARSDEFDRIHGFSLGVDDYVVKPFSPAELMQRVKAILRRIGPATRRSDPLLACGDLILDSDSHTVMLGDTALSLTPSEYRLLHGMLEAPGRVFSRDDLLDFIHPEGGAVIDRVVDVHVSNLRRKIEHDPSRPRYVRTVRGAGYKLVEPDAA